jgi:SAM-dependent methyltransferase
MKPEVLRRVSRLRSFVPATFDTLPGKAGDLKVYDGSRKTIFYHCGDFGDIIYALPTIRAMGGGDLVIGPEMKLGFEVKTRQRFTLEVFDIIAPLLRIQPYLSSVRFSLTMPEVDVDLNKFRRYFLEESDLRRKGDRRLNLAETHLWTFQQPLDACGSAWLAVDKVEKVPDRPVLIHRSPRWRNHEFPWDKVLKAHGHHAVFVGQAEEHRDFVAEWNYPLPFLPTKDFLELARLIAGSELYIGNQSAPYAIAEGLKKNTLQEVWPEGPNCLFPRDNAHYGDGKLVYIPKLAKTMTTEIINTCPMCGSPKAAADRTRADIVKCAECNIVYLRTRPSRESMEARYQTYADGASHMRLPITVDEMRTSGLRREYFMQELLSYVDKPGGMLGKLLDIGCGWGAFLANAREKGFEAEGVEICAKMANFANSVMGLKVHASQLYDICVEPGSFNVVSIIHVFEHLPGQKEALACIHAMLRPKGIFCGIVPNYGSLCSKSLRDQWSWLDPEMHYIHFTPLTLQLALEKYGFKVLKLYTHTGDFDVTTIVDQVRKQNNMPMSNDEVAARIEAHWLAGEGEEIRFFAQK